MKIALSVALALLLVGCGSSEEKKVTQKVEPKKVVEKHTKEKVVEVDNEVKEEVVPKKLSIVGHNPTPVAKSGAQVYKVCSSCHGANAEKKALGKSHVIKGWDVAKITKAINGYKAGTYGGTMKGLMKSQVSKLSDSEIKAVAEHISKL